MSPLYCAIIIFCLFCKVYCQQQDSFGGANVTFILEHSLSGNQEFKFRTKIQLVSRPDGKQGTLYLDKNIIVGEDVGLFRKLISSNELYTVRMRTEREESKEHYVISSIPICALQKAAFKEDFQVFLDANGNIIGASYSVPPMTIAQTCDPSKIKETIQFQTRIRIGDELKGQSIPAQVAGPLPPYLQKVRLSADDETEQTQQGGQQKTFFQRYWYVIVGLLLYSFLSGGGAAPAAGKEEGQQQQSQSKTTAN